MRAAGPCTSPSIVIEADELRRRFELISSMDLEVEWLRPRACRELEPGLAPTCAGGVHAPQEAAVDPRLLLPALAAAVTRKGGEIVVGAEVTDALIEEGRLVGVATAEGREHRARRVLLATGAWAGTTPWLPTQARPPVRPVKGQVLTLRGSPELRLCDRIVASERVYVVPRPDGRLIVGATVEERGFDVQVTAGAVLELLREAYRALPDIAELELVETRVGLRPGTPDNAPLIGPAALDGLLIATGHYRNGILMAPLTAEAIAAMLSSESPPAAARLAHPGRFAGEGASGLAVAPMLGGGPSMIVALNGRPAELPDGATVFDAVKEVGVDGESRGVAVAVDGEVIRRAEWGATKLAGDQAVEVVRAVQGG